MAIFGLFFDCIFIVVVAGKLLAWPCGRISRINFHLFRCFCFVCLAGFCLAVLIVQLQRCCWPEVQVGLGNTWPPPVDSTGATYDIAHRGDRRSPRGDCSRFFFSRFSFDLPLCIYDSQLAQCPPVKAVSQSVCQSVWLSVSLSIGVIVIDAATK